MHVLQNVFLNSERFLLKSDIKAFENIIRFFFKS